MTFRLAKLLVIWVALFSIAAPTLACMADREDCCPTESTPPCDECPDPVTQATSDCVTAPAALLPAWSADKTDAPQSDLDPAVAPPPESTPVDVGKSPGAAPARPAPRPAASTYLLTGRLRL